MNVLIGTAGWSYADWAGIVYPKPRPKGFHETSYLSRYFDTLEINTSFYGEVAPAKAAAWVQQVEANPRFRFTAKLHQSFTHARNPSDADERGFRAMADTLADAGRLGAVLAQFPWSFKNSDDSREYLDAMTERLRGYPLVVEVRHQSWNDPAFFEMLRERRVGFCNVDQPVMGKSLGPSSQVTSPVGYVRLHGRNYQSWFAKKKDATPTESRNARYDYLYSADEVEEWHERVEQVAEGAAATYVIANNHFRGQAAANALQLTSLIARKPVEGPAELARAYPQLEGYVVTAQKELFSRG